MKKNYLSGNTYLSVKPATWRQDLICKFKPATKDLKSRTKDFILTWKVLYWLVADRIRQWLHFLLERQGVHWDRYTRSWIHHQVQAPETHSQPSHQIHERLMKLRLPISDNRFIIIIRVYASTMTCTEKIREQFYANLDTKLRDTPSTDKLVILSNFNAWNKAAYSPPSCSTCCSRRSYSTQWKT